MKLEALLLVILAPLPFWALGLPWSSGDARRVRLAPLVGCALAGFYAELALVAGLPVRASVAVLTAASAGMVILRWTKLRASLIEAAREWAPIYLVAVLAASVSPFPILGNWSGDWLLIYQMGQSVIRDALPGDMLARPPLFGAAAAPLWLLADGLIPYQIMAAVASASAVTATLTFIHHFWPKAPRIVLLPLLLSPFFMHHTAAAWAKLLAAGLILAAFIESLRARPFASGALFALSVAVHEGSVVWAPCILLAHGAQSRDPRDVVRALWPMVAMGVVIAGPLQVWILLKYGLAAKVAANPVVTEHDQVPFLVKTLLAVITSFVGWGPFRSLARWLANPDRLAPAVVAKEAYWLITSWMTTLSSTLLGLLFPFLFVRRGLASPDRLKVVFGSLTAAAVAFAVIANALLTGFYSNEGTMQAALTPLALGLYGLLAGLLPSDDERRTRSVKRMAWLTGVVGTLPWLVTNLAISAGMWLSPAVRERFLAGSEGDYFRVLDNNLQTLGMFAFPEVPLLCIALLVACGWAQYRGWGLAGGDGGRSATKVALPDHGGNR